MKLLDICKIGGKSVKKYQGLKKYVATGDVINNAIASFKNVSYENKPSRANVEIDGSDVLFAKMKDTIKTLCANTDNINNIYSTGFYVLKPTNNVIQKYLYYYLNSESFNAQKNRLCSGATQKALNNEGLDKIIIKDIPTIVEQEKIIERLTIIDNLINLKNNQINKLELLVKSQFVEMFGDPVLNSKGWNLYKFPELGDFGRGVSKHRPRNATDLLNGSYPLIQTGDVSNSGLYIKTYNSTYSELGLKQSKMWPKGTLCITIAANIAQTGILNFDACFPDSIVGFNPNDKVKSIFIHYWFSFLQKIIDSKATQVAQKNINLQILSELDVIVPPIELQNKFAQIVEQIDKQKFEFEKSLKHLEEMKSSLMQEYFG